MFYASEWICAGDLLDWYLHELDFSPTEPGIYARQFIQDLLSTIQSGALTISFVAAVSGLDRYSDSIATLGGLTFGEIPEREAIEGSRRESTIGDSIPRIGFRATLDVPIRITEDYVDGIREELWKDPTSEMWRDNLSGGLNSIVRAIHLVSDCSTAVSHHWISSLRWPWFLLSGSAYHVPPSHDNLYGNLTETQWEEANFVAHALLSLDASKRSSGINFRLAIDRLAESVAGLNPDDQILDAMIAAEASILHKAGVSEMTAKLALRCAWLLGDSPESRGVIFKTMKAAYDARSKVAHGENAPKLNADLIRDAQDIVRRCIRRLVDVNPPNGDWERYWASVLVGGTGSDEVTV